VNRRLERPYTLRAIQEMLGISRSVVTGLIGAGFVTPVRGARNEYRFSFQDVVLLRTAYDLRAARIPPRRILRSLQRLKAALPRELPLTGLRITAVGNDIAVRDGSGQWASETGQLLMDFEVSPAPGTVAILPHGSASNPANAVQATSRAGPRRGSAAEWFIRGEKLEETAAKAAAEAAYRRAVAIAPDYADAWLNLGAMLCEAGRCGEAAELYDEALVHCPDEALLHYNRAIALEDLGRIDEAITSYETCLELAPAVADAHFNAARLYEQAGNAQKAVRHFSAYRRLQRQRP
jgi:tetratricopeptide (TPR) repeat protein